MKQVVFVDTTRKVTKRKERWGWYIVGVLAILAFGVFIYHPDWLLVPPNL
jgi:bacteriorhodopsin